MPSIRGPLPEASIVAECLNGTVRACRDFANLSGNTRLIDAPEWFVQAEIAKTVQRRLDRWVTLETSVEELMGSSGKTSRDSRSGIRKGRIDLVVWSVADEPRSLVEVKKGWGDSSIDDDVSRLRALVNKCEKVVRGLVVVYADAAKEETLVERFSRMAQCSGSELLAAKRVQKWDRETSDSWYWSAAVFKVKH